MSLNDEIEKLRDWASHVPSDQGTGEWDYFYPNWNELYVEFQTFLDGSGCTGWNEKTINNVLYAIARDNEAEDLIRMIAESEKCLFFIAENVIGCKEWNARWQVAAYLGEVKGDKERAESYLLKLVKDENEYVRRRSLLALAELDSSKTESLAEVAWKTGHEYQRIAALHALHKVESQILEEYLNRADKDGRTIVVQNADEIRGKKV